MRRENSKEKDYRKRDIHEFLIKLGAYLTITRMMKLKSSLVYIAGKIDLYVRLCNLVSDSESKLLRVKKDKGVLTLSVKPTRHFKSTINDLTRRQHHQIIHDEIEE